MTAKDYYLILGVSRTDSLEDIRAAYLDLAYRHHPDRAGPEGTRRLQEINAAFEVISSPERRAEYDQQVAACCRSSWTGGPRRPWPAPEPMIPGGGGFGFRSGAGGYGAGQPLTIELWLQPGDAARGDLVSLAIPVHIPCQACGGAGGLWELSCRSCDGSGGVMTTQRIQVPLPPRLEDGDLYRVPLEGYGIQGLSLDLLIRIDHAPRP